MTYFSEAEAYIHSFTRFGSQLGLDRMKKLLELMGNPQDKLDFIHIAGTNGKGSTVKMCASILEKAGYNVGMYISPFVIDFRERFQVNSKMISKPDFSTLVKKIKPLVDKLANEGDQVTEFEVITAIAFEYFYRAKCDIVCLEVGLGGKYDATNVIKSPLAAIITSISLDHTEILGKTIEAIAGEKAGIIKENTSVFTYPLQEEDAIKVFKEQCEKTNSRFTLPDKSAVSIISESIDGTVFKYKDEKYSIRFVGEHQVYNAVAVIEAMNSLNGKGFIIERFDIAGGLSKATFPARFEIVRKKPLIILDGTHNSQAGKALVRSLGNISQSPKVAIMGMMADKDYDATLSYVLKECDALITIPVNNPRAIDPKILAKVGKKYCDNVSCENDYETAVKKAFKIAGEDGVMVFCGSFYMVSDMRKVVDSYLHKKGIIKSRKK